jgi:hypothetical protein
MVDPAIDDVNRRLSPWKFGLPALMVAVVVASLAKPLRDELRKIAVIKGEDKKLVGIVQAVERRQKIVVVGDEERVFGRRLMRHRVGDRDVLPECGLCIAPTSVPPSGVMASPSIPLFATRPDALPLISAARVALRFATANLSSV